MIRWFRHRFRKRVRGTKIRWRRRCRMIRGKRGKNILNLCILLSSLCTIRSLTSFGRQQPVRVSCKKPWSRHTKTHFPRVNSRHFWWELSRSSKSLLWSNWSKIGSTFQLQYKGRTKYRTTWSIWRSSRREKMTPKWNMSLFSLNSKIRKLTFLHLFSNLYNEYFLFVFFLFILIKIIFVCMLLFMSVLFSQNFISITVSTFQDLI